MRDKVLPLRICIKYNREARQEQAGTTSQSTGDAAPSNPTLLALERELCEAVNKGTGDGFLTFLYGLILIDRCDTVAAVYRTFRNSWVVLSPTYQCVPRLETYLCMLVTNTAHTHTRLLLSQKHLAPPFPDREQHDQARTVLVRSLQQYPCNWGAWKALETLCPDAATATALALPRHWLRDLFMASLSLTLHDHAHALQRLEVCGQLRLINQPENLC